MKTNYHRWRKYCQWYIALIKNAVHSSNEYTESHHVFPISIFGRNNRTVILTGRQHFLAHKLLAKIYLYRYGIKNINYRRMQRACVAMSRLGEVRINSRRFDFCRKMSSEIRKGIIVSDITREKMRIAVTGRKMSDENRKKLIKILTGRKHTAETRAKMSAVRIGMKFSDSHRAKMSEVRKGIKMPNEQRDKISRSMLGKKKSKETRDKMKKASSFRCKPVSTTNGIFNSIAEAADYYGVSHTTILYRIKTKPNEFYYIKNNE
jgi:hypothetical protein